VTVFQKAKETGLLFIAAGNVNGAGALANHLAVPQMLSTEFPHDPAIPCLDIYLGETKTHVSTKTYSQQHYL
jgi:hypothetical protein